MNNEIRKKKINSNEKLNTNRELNASNARVLQD